ncbi:MAG: DUF4239 domain-containing protein [Planctomycetes bacterium]|nr:DUF4239 domain-containing protein [Planctomycetota bacterium]
MRTILLLGLTVVASIVAAVVGLCVVRLVVPPAVLQANNDVGGNYLQTLGTIYAVLLAFVVFVVWTQQNDAWKLVERQANELADVLRIVQVFGEPVKSRVLDAVRAYVREVAEREWPAMAHGRSSPRAAQLLETLWQELVAFEPKTTREETLYTEAVARFNNLSDARTDLLLNSRTRLPPTLWILLVTGGFSTVASMYLFGLESFWSLALMTGSMAGAVSFVLFLIRDLDTPFSGDWQVTPEPILLVLGQVENL